MVAVLFEPTEGARLLNLWGYSEMARTLGDEHNSSRAGHEEATEDSVVVNRIEYVGLPLTDDEMEEVRRFIGFLRSKRV